MVEMGDYIYRLLAALGGTGVVWLLWERLYRKMDARRMDILMEVQRKNIEQYSLTNKKVEILFDAVQKPEEEEFEEEKIKFPYGNLYSRKLRIRK
jgi:hypothetical protein